MVKISFPKNITEPIARFLRIEERKLSKTKKNLEKEDPFKDPARVSDNAAIDVEAAEQFGHTNVEGLRREIDRKLIQVRKALTRIKVGKYGTCEICGEMIDTDRLIVFPSATVCVKCEKKKAK